MDNKIVGRLSLRSGEATFSIKEAKHGKFLNIKGNTTVSLYSDYGQFNDLDYYLREDSPYKLHCNKN